MKKIHLMITFCLVIFSSQALSHAVVTHSSLDVTEISANQPTQVKLTFNSRVELDLSQIFLVSRGDKMQLVNASLGQKPGQIVIDIPALAPGEYALKLSIFAADGHISEDLVRFHVLSETASE